MVLPRSPHLWRRDRTSPDVGAERRWGLMNMGSKGSAGKFEAAHALRVGVIGAGVMGTNHARVLAGLPNTILVGVVDPLLPNRTRATEMTGCQTFAKLDELIAEGVDAVTIAAPTHLHHEVALACIAHKINLLVE